MEDTEIVKNELKEVKLLARLRVVED